MSKFRGQVTVEETDDGSNDENVVKNRLRRIQSVSGGSPPPPVTKSSARRKSQTNPKNVIIKTSKSSQVPTPGSNRNNGVASSSNNNDIVLHVGGSAWTRESLAYGDNSGPVSSRGSRSNIHRTSLDQSSLISSTSIINQEVPSIRPSTADSLTLTRSPKHSRDLRSNRHHKVAGEYIQSKADGSFQNTDFQSIQVVEGQYPDRNVVNIELVQNAFKEYKSDINQSLSDLDTKLNRLENMIKVLVERVPVVPQVDLKKSTKENKTT